MTITPAYGRDYKSAKAALADFNAGKDFLVADISSRWHGLPVDRQSLIAAGERHVLIRYNNLTKITMERLA